MTSKGYSMEFHGTLESPNKKITDSMGFHRIWRAPFQMTQVFHWIFHGIPLKSGAVKWNMTLFHGFPRNLKLSFYGMFPWTSNGYSMQFHGTLESPNKISPSFMWFHGIRSAPCQMTQVFHGIFHGIPWNSCAAKWNITQFRGIPWNIPWNSMELWCRQMKYHLVPWNSMELWDCHFMTCYPGLPRDIPWNSMELWSRQI